MKKFEKKLIQYIPNLRRYALALTSNSHCHADDLVQDTLERALVKNTLWVRNSNLRAWLFTIMHNLFINQVNKSNLYALEDIDEHKETQISADDPAQDYFVAQLKQNLENLPMRQKEVMLLVSLEGFSYEEVAKILDIPVGTVMSRLHRSREKLRQTLFKEKITPLRQVN
ncbi:MAG: RNA polymerase sigma factor [Gammaproteobacteria bacterium]|nr:RNA polymerase sigma factor [Gammaproteobacteria bacterium]